jgi:hypothetical protein
VGCGRRWEEKGKEKGWIGGGVSNKRNPKGKGNRRGKTWGKERSRGEHRSRKGGEGGADREKEGYGE